MTASGLYDKARYNPPAMAGTPNQIGPYAVEAEIGRGGMGVVFRARDPKLGRAVAVKVLPEEFAKDAPRSPETQVVTLTTVPLTF
jgi:serine/threonine protein kinase